MVSQDSLTSKLIGVGFCHKLAACTIGRIPRETLPGLGSLTDSKYERIDLVSVSG